MTALCGCGSAAPDPPPPDRPHLVLIVIDALRADHVGAYGYPRPTTPRIDALAERGALFESASATASWTKPSVGSLFTSRLPSEHGAVSFARHLDAALPTLAELLGSAGYHTLGVSGNFVHVSEETGFARGFRRFEVVRRRGHSEAEAIWEREKRGERIPLRAPRGRELNREVLRWLPSAGEEPLFLYVHYMEPHAPYAPDDALRQAFRSDAAHPPPRLVSSARLVALARGEEIATPRERRAIVDLYDAEVAAADAALGELLAALDGRGYGEDTVVAVTSDHGEELGEHGSFFHGMSLHRESIAVPLIFRARGRLAPGVRRADPVDLLDVAPTLLALAGVAAPPSMRGRDLFSEPLRERDVVAELREDPAVLPPRQRLSLARGPWKALVPVRGEPVVYRIDRDPHETRPLAPDASLGARAIAERARALARAPLAGEHGAGNELDPAVLEELRALGYVR